jgi:hypothetical protein
LLQNLLEESEESDSCGYLWAEGLGVWYRSRWGKNDSFLFQLHTTCALYVDSVPFLKIDNLL